MSHDDWTFCPWDGSQSLSRPDWPALHVGKLTLDTPDVHLQVFRESRLAARASLWTGFHSDGHATGMIGHYAAESLEAGRTLLQAACRRLRDAGCARVIGPIDGSTWKPYRLVSDAGSEAPFLLEPINPHAWNHHFLESGFGVLASYHSALSVNPAPDPKMPAVRARLSASGVSTRAADPARLDAELAAIHELALDSFSRNPLYSPLSRGDFLALYRPLLSRLPAGFTRIAEHAGRAVGFAFAAPDLLRPQNDTLIVKTVGVRRGRLYAGLGRLLAEELHELARRAGLPRVIHALMHDDNVSARTSAHTSTVIWRYALYSRSLTGMV